MTRDKNPQFIGTSQACAKQIANARGCESLLDADFAEYHSGVCAAAAQRGTYTQN